MPSVQIRNIVIKRDLFFFIGGEGEVFLLVLAGCTVATGNVLLDVKQFAKANLPFLKKV